MASACVNGFLQISYFIARNGQSKSALPERDRNYHVLSYQTPSWPHATVLYQTKARSGRIPNPRLASHLLRKYDGEGARADERFVYTNDGFDFFVASVFVRVRNMVIGRAGHKQPLDRMCHPLFLHLF